MDYNHDYEDHDNDMHHEKTNLKVFVVVIPKKDGRACPCPSFFWHDNNFSEFDSADIIMCFMFQRVNDTDSLEFWVSHNRGPFQKAEFPTNLKHSVSAMFIHTL